MPIRPSASADIRQLIEALGGTDEVKRESAVARLAVIGSRAAEQLLTHYPSATPAVRAGMLRAFDAIGDARALPLARAALSDPSQETVTAAVGVLRGFLTSPQAVHARDALDAVVAAALDTSRPAALRLAALDALRVLPADVGDAVRKNLSDDRDPDVRARAASPVTRGTGQAAPATDEAVWREAVAGRLPGSPSPLKHALAARRTTAPLTELQHLVDHLRMREQRETAERREEWRALRGAVHQALAARNSRLALYDLRDSLLDPDRLPVAFLAAIEEIGDATCLETLAAAYEASSRSGDAWWREHVATAFRAIVLREGLTRRHAAVKRMVTRWPEAAADLMARL